MGEREKERGEGGREARESLGGRGEGEREEWETEKGLGEGRGGEGQELGC